MLNSGIPGEVARHSGAVLTALFLGFLCAYVALRARERRSPGLPRWVGPASWGWICTVTGALLLILFTFAGLNLHHPLSLSEIMAVGPQRVQEVEGGRAHGGRLLLKASVAVLPAAVALIWLAMAAWARRHPPAPGRHSALVLCGLLVSAAGLLIFLAVYAERLAA